MKLLDPRLLLAVLAGGGIGSVLRYAGTVAIAQRFGPGFPWGTFIVNVSGSFLIGVLAEMAQTRALAVTPMMRTFLAVGVLGGYTTFSTFSLDTVNALSEGATVLAFAYAAGSVVAGVVAAFAGIVVARAF